MCSRSTSTNGVLQARPRGARLARAALRAISRSRELAGASPQEGARSIAYFIPISGTHAFNAASRSKSLLLDPIRNHENRRSASCVLRSLSLPAPP